MTNKAPKINVQSRQRSRTHWPLVLGHLLVIGTWSLVLSQPTPPLYQADFQQSELSKLPSDMKALAGEFAVKQESENRFLELSPFPLNTFGVLVGPERDAGTSIHARTRSWPTGKRYPEMGVSLGGAGGFRLMLMPAVSEVQIRQEDKIIARSKFEWKPGAWVHLQLESRGVVAGSWTIAGKAWHDGEPIPAEATVRHISTAQQTTGRSAVWAVPYSEKPIQFDDLLIETRPTPE